MFSFTTETRRARRFHRGIRVLRASPCTPCLRGETGPLAATGSLSESKTLKAFTEGTEDVMRRHLPKTTSLLAVVLALGSPAMTQDNAAVFGLRMAPILEAHCAKCHGGPVPQSDFSIASFDSVLRGGKHGSALTPGSAAQSLLMQYVRGEKSPRMPLGSQLPAEIIEQLAEAINGMKPLTDAARPVDAHW